MDMLTLFAKHYIEYYGEYVFLSLIDLTGWTPFCNLSLTLLEDRLITTPVNHSIPTSHPSFTEASTFI